jgi:hypothetical protein
MDETMRMPRQFEAKAGAVENLNAKDIVRGSVVSDQGLVEGEDYAVDYKKGTITLLKQPTYMVGKPVERENHDGVLEVAMIEEAVPFTHVNFHYEVPLVDVMAPVRERQADARETLVQAARKDPTILALLELSHPDIAEQVRGAS